MSHGTVEEHRGQYLRHALGKYFRIYVRATLNKQRKVRGSISQDRKKWSRSHLRFARSLYCLIDPHTNWYGDIVTQVSSKDVNISFRVIFLCMTYHKRSSCRQVDLQANKYNCLKLSHVDTHHLSSCSEAVRAASVLTLGQVQGKGIVRQCLAALSSATTSPCLRELSRE